MKSLLPIGLVCLLVSCAKNSDQPSPEETTQERTKETCTFGIEIFNLTKREPLSLEATQKPRNGGGNGGNGGGGGGSTPTTPTYPTNPTPPPPTTGGPVLLLDFDGHNVSGTWWNTNGDINCRPANLLTSEQALVLDRVTNDYSPFNVTVTLDENAYNAAPANRRSRIVITESYEWYGQAGGVSYIGSFTDGYNNPSFVFSSLLYYNTKYIAEAVSHEAGHALGLLHQVVYSSGCTMTGAYNSGLGYGETGWAPIMGVSYSQNLSLWHNGTNSSSCNTFQDELSRLSSILGYRTDDHVNSTAGATGFAGSASGIINNSNDVDYFYVNAGSPLTVSVTPFNAGPANSGANTDLVLKIYNSQGSLVSVINDPSVLHAVGSINSGSYYLSVSTAANSNTSNYGMLGKYSISVY